MSRPRPLGTQLVFLGKSARQSLIPMAKSFPLDGTMFPSMAAAHMSLISGPIRIPNVTCDVGTLMGGTCFNDQEKKLISEMIVAELISNEVIAEANREKASKIVSNSKVKGLIEFSRSIHAEMHAILGAGHLAGGRLKGGALFCTTYPCHSCARHIIAAGISDVYYIEPYRKSLATKLHSDAIN